MFGSSRCDRGALGALKAPVILALALAALPMLCAPAFAHAENRGKDSWIPTLAFPDPADVGEACRA